jgi:hypothetical protein
MERSPISSSGILLAIMGRFCIIANYCATLHFAVSELKPRRRRTLPPTKGELMGNRGSDAQ